MDSLTHNPFDLGLNVGADFDAIRLANSDKSLVDVWVELGSNILAFEGHALRPVTHEISRINKAKKYRHAALPADDWKYSANFSRFLIPGETVVPLAIFFSVRYETPAAFATAGQFPFSF